MNTQSVLKQVAEMAKISDKYMSAWGQEAYVEDETIYQLLDCLGYDIRSDETLLHSATKKHKKELLAAVQVVKESEQPILIRVNAAKSVPVSHFSWSLLTESGEQLEGALQSNRVSDERAEGGALCFELAHLPWGYHQLSIIRKGRAKPYQMKLIVTPNACYKQPSLAQGKKMWGPSIQLYTLRSQHNWGIGDFGDLKKLITEIAKRGGDFLGLNPIHSLFPAMPEDASPYSPSSRRWLNLLYIDINAVPELTICEEARERLTSCSFQQRLDKVRALEWVDYSEVATLKMGVLPLLFTTFKVAHLDKQTQRASDFHDFVEAGGDSLLQQATFDALHAQLHAQDCTIWGWPVFPKKYRKFNSAAVQTFITENEGAVQAYLYFQWLADTQIREAQALAEQSGMAVGLYRDLAVGVAGAGAETWADKGNLVLNASIGAPPDVLGPLGQNWGLPPLDPQQLRATGYEAYIALLRANMKHCGALRIDHVLGLLRLWWIAKGKGATDGAYVYYPVEDMLAILALESHRHRCAVIGEDLGTVPKEIELLLADAGIYSYKLFFFETAQDGGFISPSHYKAESISALCTHDMPTLRGFWHCDDLKIGKSLGLYKDTAQLDALYAGRLANKQSILESVAWHGYLPQGVGRDASLVPMDSYLSEALQLHLGAGASALLSVQLEDWLEMDKPVNIPGTVDEYPNWRRKLSMDLDEMFSAPQVNSIAQQLTNVRAEASKR